MQTSENLKIKDEINEFMSQLFPDDELKEYVWEHLVNFIGENASQTSNIYKGDGSNGKSLLTVLMSMCLVIIAIQQLLSVLLHLNAKPWRNII